MDDVNDSNKGPVPQIEETVLQNRRIGMGVMGWADTLIELGIPYDSKAGRDLAEEVMGFITDTAKKTSVDLAKEKGVFPAFDKSVYNDGNPENRVRNVQRTTIAPTGTISMIYDTSSGIEPLFAIAWQKHIRGGDSLSYIHPKFEREAKSRGLNLEKLLPLIEENHGSIQGIGEIPKDLQEVFKTAHDLSYQSHVLMQAAFQEKTDNAVSKTINMKTDASVEDVEGAYMLAWKSGLKGITVYRDGSKDIQVLTTGYGNDDKEGGITRKELSDLVMARLSKPRPRGGKIRGMTEKIDTPFGDAFVTFNSEGENGDSYPYESFINLGKAGGDIGAISEGFGRLISMSLRVGIDPYYIVNQLKGIKGETQMGLGPKKVTSLPDGIAKGMEEILSFNQDLENQPKKKKDIEMSGNFCPGTFIFRRRVPKMPLLWVQ